MDELVLRAMAKWPNVPALYGWLELTRRGQWLLQGKRVEHEALADFISRNYAADAEGHWYFQNGPQRVYITLAYVPWVLRLQADGRLQTHTGQSVGTVSSALIDENGHLLLAFENGVGLLMDTDLEWAIGQFRGIDGSTLDNEVIDMALESLQSGRGADMAFMYQGQLVAMDSIRSADVAQRFGFVREPRPNDED